MALGKKVHRFFQTGPWGVAFEAVTSSSSSHEPRCLHVTPGGDGKEVLQCELAPCAPGKKRIVAISDTHGKHRLVRVPAGDVLIHAGDILSRNACLLQNNGRNHKKGRAALREFNAWLGELPHRVKVVIGGNHDATLEEIGDERARVLLGHAVYLHDSSAEVDGLRIYGSPWSCGKSANRAFQALEPKALPQPAELGGDVDVLVSHDYCEAYTAALRPKLHVSGHAHNSHGLLRPSQPFGGVAINASICDDVYRAVHLPVVYDVDV